MEIFNCVETLVLVELKQISSDSLKNEISYSVN